MSAAGSKRVNVVQRKLIGLSDALAGSSVTTTSGHAAKAGSPANRAAAPGSVLNAGPPTTRHPPQNTLTSVTPDGTAAALNCRGSSRTGSPNPSQTPLDPSLTAGPV